MLALAVEGASIANPVEATGKKPVGAAVRRLDLLAMQALWF